MEYVFCRSGGTWRGDAENNPEATTEAEQDGAHAEFNIIDIEGIREKPKNISFINAGIYIFKSKLISGIKAKHLKMSYTDVFQFFSFFQSSGFNKTKVPN